MLLSCDARFCYFVDLIFSCWSFNREFCGVARNFYTPIFFLSLTRSKRGIFLSLARSKSKYDHLLLWGFFQSLMLLLSNLHIALNSTSFLGLNCCTLRGALKKSYKTIFLWHPLTSLTFMRILEINIKFFLFFFISIALANTLVILSSH